jgi:hypothetical protein
MQSGRFRITQELDSIHPLPNCPALRLVPYLLGTCNLKWTHQGFWAYTGNDVLGELRVKVQSCLPRCPSEGLPDSAPHSHLWELQTKPLKLEGDSLGSSSHTRLCQATPEVTESSSQKHMCNTWMTQMGSRARISCPKASHENQLTVSGMERQPRLLDGKTRFEGRWKWMC